MGFSKAGARVFLWVSEIVEIPIPAISLRASPYQRCSSSLLGKFSTRGNNGFAPNGFSTPIMAVSGPQSRITNRPGEAEIFQIS